MLCLCKPFWKSVNPRFFPTILLPTVLLASSSVAKSAGLTVDLTNQLGNDVSRTFTSGILSIEFNFTPPPSSMPSPANTQDYVTSSANGYCIFANQSDSTSRCGTSSSGQTLNFTSMTNSVSALLTGGNIKQIIGSGSQIDIYTSLNGPSVASFASATGEFTLSSPILLAANQSIYFGSSGTNTSTRLQNLQFQVPPPSVPAPTAILGATAAFGWSRRLRNRISSKA